jgi:hypothetical protein
VVDLKIGLSCRHGPNMMYIPYTAIRNCVMARVLSMQEVYERI